MDNIEFFDYLSSSWIHNLDKETLDFISSFDLNSASKILDLGGGYGLISDILASKTTGQVYLLDISPKMIEKAKKKIRQKNVSFLNMDFYDSNLSNFDYIFVFDAYPHFLNKEQFVDKCNETLKKGGVLVIFHDDNKENLNSHHNKHALNISRRLLSVEEEAKLFMNNFEIVSLSESDKFYRIILRKK